MSGDLSSQAGGGPGSRQEVGCQQAREGRSALIWVRRGGLRAEEGANVCLALGPGGTAGLARYRDGNWFGGLWDPNSEDSRWPPIVTASSRYPRRSTHPPVADADAKVIVPQTGVPAAQVRGVLADRVIVSTQLDPFLSLKALATYSGLSRRKLRDYLADPTHPLPCYRIGGKILVRRSEYDAWAASYRQVGQADVDRVVSDVLKGL